HILLYFMLMVIAIGVFTVPYWQTFTLQTVILAEEIQFHSYFFNRFESLFLIIWILTVYTTLVSGHYYGSLGLSQTLKKQPFWFYIWALPVMYIIAMYPKGLNQLFQMAEYIGISFLFVAGMLPLILYMISVFRGQGYV